MVQQKCQGLVRITSFPSHEIRWAGRELTTRAWTVNFPVTVRKSTQPMSVKSTKVYPILARFTAQSVKRNSGQLTAWDLTSLNPMKFSTSRVTSVNAVWKRGTISNDIGKLTVVTNWMCGIGVPFAHCESRRRRKVHTRPSIIPNQIHMHVSCAKKAKISGIRLCCSITSRKSTQKGFPARIQAVRRRFPRNIAREHIGSVITSKRMNMGENANAHGQGAPRHWRIENPCSFTSGKFIKDGESLNVTSATEVTFKSSQFSHDTCH